VIITVSGWRGWTDAPFVVERLRGYGHAFGSFSAPGEELFWRVGDCKTGVDAIVRGFLTLQKVPASEWTVYRADWATYDLAAGPIRNGYMLRGEFHPQDPHPDVQTDRLLAFPQPGINWKTDKSGTVGCILDAVGLGIDLDVPGYTSK
jgi:hypothetical protein